VNLPRHRPHLRRAADATLQCRIHCDIYGFKSDINKSNYTALKKGRQS
jgi:hypothetical protein